MIYEDEIEKRSADAAAAKEKAEAAAAAADNGAATSGSGDENGGSSLSSLEVRSIPALAKHFTLSALDENIFNHRSMTLYLSLHSSLETCERLTVMSITTKLLRKSRILFKDSGGVWHAIPPRLTTTNSSWMTIKCRSIIMMMPLPN
jgi:hypothetical protein